jgi:hypothetical protein
MPHKMEESLEEVLLHLRMRKAEIQGAIQLEDPANEERIQDLQEWVEAFEEEIEILEEQMSA